MKLVRIMVCRLRIGPGPNRLTKFVSTDSGVELVALRQWRGEPWVAFGLAGVYALAGLKQADHPEAAALKAECLQLNRRLRATLLAFGAALEALEYFERKRLAPLSPTLPATVDQPTF